MNIYFPVLIVGFGLVCQGFLAISHSTLFQKLPREDSKRLGNILILIGAAICISVFAPIALRNIIWVLAGLSFTVVLLMFSDKFQR